ncbi:MAG: 4'-phosphopantetheinyl transferase superfamily protein [Bacteroidales bacterium]|jgi:4'-phosphopantetheinyl transferase EntD|nr:4'-phosphopantetheinyl transferase superfamily protein [Bacteroidales bacterium]
MPLYSVQKIGKNELLALWKMEENAAQLLSMFKMNEKQLIEYQSIKAENRKKEWLSVRLLLQHCIPQPFDLQHIETGKPFLKSTNHQISISHSQNFVAIYLSDNQYIGIDIEKKRLQMEHLQSKFLHPLENQNYTNDELLFLWCAKEVMYKIFSQKQPLMTQNLYISQINADTQQAIGYFQKKDSEQKVQLFYQNIEDNLLVWGKGNN